MIVDDGSHIPSHQMASWHYLFKTLKPGGIYVIEDLHTSYMHEKYEGAGYNEPTNTITKIKVQ